MEDKSEWILGCSTTVKRRENKDQPTKNDKTVTEK